MIIYFAFKMKFMLFAHDALTIQSLTPFLNETEFDGAKSCDWEALHEVM